VLGTVALGAPVGAVSRDRVPMSSIPKVKAFLLCDQAIQSVDGKHSVIGVFQRIHAAEYPVFHHRFGIYIRLGEMRGEYSLSVKFVDPDSEKTLAEAKLQGINHDRPLDDFESSVNLPGLEIPHPGTFEVRLFANGEFIHVDTLRAAKIDLPKPQSDGDQPPGLPGGDGR
jgi:hypothetical protein